MKLICLIVVGFATTSFGAGAADPKPQDLIPARLFKLSLQVDPGFSGMKNSLPSPIGQVVITDRLDTIDERPVVPQPLARPAGDLIDDRH